MKRSYIYILVTILALVLVISEYIIERDLEDVSSYNETDVTDLGSSHLIESGDGVEYGDATVSSTTTLTITNNQNDTEDVTYSYTIIVNDISGAYRGEINTEEKYVVFDTQGKASITLNRNESIIIYGLPVDVEYEIIQKENDNYVTKVNNETTNKYSSTLELDGNHVIFFNISNNINKITNKNKNNPITVDYIMYAFIILILSLGLCVVLRKIHVKKFR